jgi:hypothetical protein
MTLDEKLLDVVRVRFPGIDPAAKLKGICQGAFRSGDGYTFLCLLNEAVPPMLPSVVEGANDSASVGLREGRREVSALIYRLSGRTPDNTPDP